jgi:hypothetical protein
MLILGFSVNPFLGKHDSEPRGSRRFGKVSRGVVLPPDHLRSFFKAFALTGVCTACNRRFIAPRTPGEDPLHRMTHEFNEHDCNEDASQARPRS